VDYHTVVGGVLSAQGKIKINANTGKRETVVSWRYYLCDASFLAAIQADELVLIEQLAQAILTPKWPIYLGRKSCPPSRSPFAGTGEYPSLKSALQSFPLRRGLVGQVVQVRAVIECPLGEGTRRRDQIDSNSHRTFLPRYTHEELLTFEVQPEE
jgi:CRISPR system Cascade subunit CasD